MGGLQGRNPEEDPSFNFGSFSNLSRVHFPELLQKIATRPLQQNSIEQLVEGISELSKKSILDGDDKKLFLAITYELIQKEQDLVKLTALNSVFISQLLALDLPVAINYPPQDNVKIAGVSLPSETSLLIIKDDGFFLPEVFTGQAFINEARILPCTCINFKGISSIELEGIFLPINSSIFSDSTVDLQRKVTLEDVRSLYSYKRSVNEERELKGKSLNKQELASFYDSIVFMTKLHQENTYILSLPAGDEFSPPNEYSLVGKNQDNTKIILKQKGNMSENIEVAINSTFLGKNEDFYQKVCEYNNGIYLDFDSVLGRHVTYSNSKHPTIPKFNVATIDIDKEYCVAPGEIGKITRSAENVFYWKNKKNLFDVKTGYISISDFLNLNFPTILPEKSTVFYPDLRTGELLRWQIEKYNSADSANLTTEARNNLTKTITVPISDLLDFNSRLLFGIDFLPANEALQNVSKDSDYFKQFREVRPNYSDPFVAYYHFNQDNGSSRYMIAIHGRHDDKFKQNFLAMFNPFSSSVAKFSDLRTVEVGESERYSRKEEDNQNLTLFMKEPSYYEIGHAYGSFIYDKKINDNPHNQERLKAVLGSSPKELNRYGPEDMKFKFCDGVYRIFMLQGDKNQSARIELGKYQEFINFLHDIGVSVNAN
jgi:hypothetical protein